MNITVISMLKNRWITGIFIIVILLSLSISYPVSGEIISANFSGKIRLEIFPGKKYGREIFRPGFTYPIETRGLAGLAY